MRSSSGTRNQTLVTHTPQAADPLAPARRRATSPLWGLWLAFAATVVACVQGVHAGEIRYPMAVLAVGCLGSVIRLAAAALDLPAQPIDVAPLARAFARLRTWRPARVRTVGSTA